MTPDLVPAEVVGGMTWQEVKDFLDHIRTTCMDERTALKLEVRHLRAEVRQVRSLIALHQQNGCGVQLMREGALAAEDLDDGCVADTGGLGDGPKC